MPSKFRFQENEKVLCFHGPLLYEAKCMKIQVKEKQVKYYVHYQGWNKSWDEWVPENRVLKCSDANVQRQRELHDAHMKSKQKARDKKKIGDLKDKDKDRDKDKDKEVVSPPISLASVEKTKAKVVLPIPAVSSPSLPTITDSKDVTPKDITGDIQRKKRIRVEPTVEHEEQVTRKLDIKIKIPDILKQHLVDDWDLITKQKKLFHLPASVTVEQILNDFVKHKTSAKSSLSKDSAFIEIANGIKEYFNTTLSTQLLYKQERAQHLMFSEREDDVLMSSIYGSFHLLRLFVKLGNLLSSICFDEKSSQLIVGYIQDFLIYLERNVTLFNLNDYKTVSENAKKT